MGKTKIEWATDVWNPVAGCTKVSPGCDHCYAEVMSRRMNAMGHPKYRDVTNAHGWTTEIRLYPGALEEPFLWKKSRRVFVCSMSDLFHSKVPWDFIGQVFDVMIAAKQHTFQVLTKRPGRMAFWAEQMAAVCREKGLPWEWPPNVWAGTSVENQKYTPRLDVLARVPAKIRFVSVEPMLGPVDLRKWLNCTGDDGMHDPPQPPVLHWCIVGGESGPGARPMDLAWVRSLRDQCEQAGAAFFFKQAIINGKKVSTPVLDGYRWAEFPYAL